MNAPTSFGRPQAGRRFFRRLLLWVALFLLVPLGTLGLFMGVGLWNATRTPVIERIAIPLEGLPPETRIRLLLIADTHAGYPDMPRRRLERIVAQANALKPDLIVLAGDYHGGKYVDWPGMRLEDALEPFAKLDAPLGVFAILGNHDQEFWTPWVLTRQKAPRLLVNAHADIGPLTIVGLDSISHRPDFPRAMQEVAADKPILLLLHEPEYVHYVKAEQPMLALAGHSHGGQVILPLIGAPSERLYGPLPCRRGMCEFNGNRVFVTSGIGTSWLPIRYGVPPEMVEITLYSGRKSGTDK